MRWREQRGNWSGKPPLKDRTFEMEKVRHYIELVFFKAYAELRAEATRLYMGFLWWFVEPVLYLGVFYLIFESGLRRGGPEFVPFLLCGLVAWKWFSSTVLTGSTVLGANAGILQQVYLPKLLFPLVIVIANTFKFTMVLALFLVFLMLTYGKLPGESWLALPVLVLVQLLLIVAVTVFVSAVVPFAQDLKMLLDNLMMMLFFMSGIFFDIGQMSEDIQRLFMLNPMAGIIGSYRSILIDGDWPPWGLMAAIAGVSALLLIAGVALYQSFDRVYPKIVLR